jgi:hypothetical protein
VITKASWRTDDVRDYAFRAYLPVQLNITQTKISAQDADTIFFQGVLATIKTQTYRVATTNAYTYGWSGNKFIFTMKQGSTLYKSITYKNQFTANTGATITTLSKFITAPCT